MSGAPPDPLRFDLTGPLPDGHLSIEASAGTGKTYTLAALAARLIAEQGVEAGQLLMVTFTRAATSELRSRVRERLADYATALADPTTDLAAKADPLLTRLAAHDQTGRAARLARAVADFDAATITTIHGFAAQVLGATGARSTADRDATLLGSDSVLFSEACADVLAAAAVDPALNGSLPKLRQLSDAARTAVTMPDVRIVPEAGQAGAAEAHLILARLVQAVRDRIEENGSRRGVRNFTGILTDLLAALHSPAGDATVAALQHRFAVALIDEFQDTDPVQWEIFRTCFPPQGTTRLVVVADPKQAIYSFRGANVQTYLGAVGSDAPMTRFALGTNWRSDKALLDALHVLFDGATFGDPRIRFAAVEAADRNKASRALDAAGTPAVPLSLRIAHGPGLDFSPKLVPAALARQAITNDLVLEIRNALDTTRIPGEQGMRTLLADDVAVLVGTRKEAESVRTALLRSGIPAVLSRGGSVLDSVAADQWRILLAAVARPADPRRARAFAVSWFSPHDADWLAEVGDAGLTTVQEQLHEWSRTLATHGVSDFVREVRSQSGVAARVLMRSDGDRDLTDLDHLAQLLATSQAGEHAGAAGLLGWLDTLGTGDADTEDADDLTARRLESEDLAVQIFTVWTSKGLEFPVVFVPFAWTQKDSQCVLTQDGERVFDVANGKSWPTTKQAGARKEQAELEALGERLRLLYVALTRAKHRTVVWWCSSGRSAKSRNALAHLLFARDGADLDPERFEGATVTVPSDAEAICAALEPLMQRAGGLIDLSVVGVGGPPSRAERASTASADPTALTLAGLPHTPDRSRVRWSFTAIIDRAVEHASDPHDASMADAGAADEQSALLAEDGPADGDAMPPSAAALSPGSPDLTGPSAGPSTGPSAGPTAGPSAGPSETNALADLPAGTAFGTLVHRVLEVVDPQADDLPAALGQAVQTALGARRFDLTPTRVDGDPRTGRERLVAGLAEVMRAPLGAALSHRTLADIPAADRLCEVAFELHLDHENPATDQAVGTLVLDHLAADDPYRPWAQGLLTPRFGVRLAGHLTGSIDAVLRVPAPDATHDRYVVVDYKTNRLQPYGTPALVEHYAPVALPDAMVVHDYPLQALLYAVALHRFLRGRLPGYEPGQHLGGAAYLFVRGMRADHDPAAADAPGVCSWAIPPALVADLSDLLAGAGGARLALVGAPDLGATD